MKIKLIALALFALFTSCSKDDNEEQLPEGFCEVQVWGVNKTVTGTSKTFTVTFGPNENDTATIETNEATYNYYYDMVYNENPNDCWEGTK